MQFFYSALFSRKESTIVTAFRQCFFFDTPGVTEIVLAKVLQTFKAPNCNFWPRELDNKSCSFLAYQTGRD